MAENTVGIRFEIGGAGQAEGDIRRVRGAMDGVADTATTVRGALGGLAAAFAGAFSVQQFLQAADAVTQLQNSLRLSTGSAAAAAQAYEDLFGVAQRSRVSFTDLGNTYATIARATQGLGVSQRDLLTVTEALGNAIAISGGSAESARAAMIQLTQGLASGALRGEELNSVLEQTPRVAKAIADGLGITIGQLREYGKEGRLSTEAVITALRSQADVLRNEVGSSTVTVGQGFQVLSNSVIKLVGSLDQATGVSRTVGQGLVLLAQNIDLVAAAATALTVSGLVVWLSATLPAAIAVTKAALVALTGPIGLAVVAATALAVGIAAVWRSMRDDGGEAAKAEAELNRLREALERQPNNLLLKKAVKDQQELVDRLRATSGAMRENENELARLGARQSERQGQLKQEAALLETVADIERQRTGQSKDFRANLDKLFQAYESGAISLDRYRTLVADLIQREGGGKKITDERAQSIKQLAGEYDKIIEAGREYAQKIQLELDIGNQLSESQRAQLKIGEFLAANAKNLTAARVAELQQLILLIARLDQERRGRDAVNEEIKAGKKAQDELYTAGERNVQQAVQRVQQLEDEKREADLAARTNISLAAAIEEVAIARLKERQEVAAMVGDARMVELLGREIAARERIRDLIVDKETAEAQKRNAEEAGKAWQKASEDIEKALTDALVRGFESGRGLVRSVGDYIVNFFKTTIARGIAQALLGALGAGLSGVANAGVRLVGGGAGGGGGGGLGSIISLISGGGSLGAGLMAGLFNGVGLGGSLTAAASLFGTGTLAGAGAGAGLALGAIAPYAAAVAGLYALITGIGTGRQRSPARQNFSLLTGSGESLPSIWPTPNLSGQGTYDSLVRGAFSTISDVARSLGGVADQTLRLGLFTSASPDNRGAQVVGTAFDRSGRILFNADRQVNNDQIDATLRDLVPRLILTGLQQSNLPDQIAAYLRRIDAASASEQEIDNVIKTALAVQGMTDAVASAGGVFARLADLSVDARVELANLTGGIEGFVQKVSGFVQDYYSESERVGITARQIQATLRAAGIQGDFRTREEFRAALEGVDLGSEQGRRQLAALLNAASSFASISDYLKANNLTLGGAAALSPAGALADAISAQRTDTEAQTATLQAGLVDLNTTLTEGIDRQLDEAVSLREEVIAALAAVQEQARRTADALEQWTIDGLPATAS